MRIDLHHRRPFASLALATVRACEIASATGSAATGLVAMASSTSGHEGQRWYRASGPACRPMPSIAKPSTMGTFVGRSQNGLDPEVSPA